jgi:hypothetical protein
MNTSMTNTQFTEAQVNEVSATIATIAKFIEGSPHEKLFTASAIAEAVIANNKQINTKSSHYDAYKLSAENVLKKTGGSKTWPDPTSAPRSSEPGSPGLGNKAVQDKQIPRSEFDMNTCVSNLMEDNPMMAREDAILSCQESVTGAYKSGVNTKNASVPNWLITREQTLSGGPISSPKYSLNNDGSLQTKAAATNQKPYWLETYDWTINGLSENIINPPIEDPTKVKSASNSGKPAWIVAREFISTGGIS